MGVVHREPLWGDIASDLSSLCGIGDEFTDEASHFVVRGRQPIAAMQERRDVLIVMPMCPRCDKRAYAADLRELLEMRDDLAFMRRPRHGLHVRHYWVIFSLSPSELATCSCCTCPASSTADRVRARNDVAHPSIELVLLLVVLNVYKPRA